MKLTMSLILLLLLLQAGAFAQSGTSELRGRLVDTLGKQTPGGATLSLLKADDSSLVTFTRADTSGVFRFRKVSPGTYLISVSHVNFHPAWRKVIAEGETQIDLHDWQLKDKSLMNEVLIKPTRPPVSVNNDTLEFNAEAFKTKPNAVVEDLLKKMPGVEVDQDGTIRVNGQRINRVFVNGREFFTGDPKLATRNLSADAVDKVQVFEKKSDRSEFTGVDDGQSQPAINLKLKKDRDNATFGRVTAGAGTRDRYDGQFNVNKFKGDRMLSAIGMANNTNRQGFDIMDIMNFTGELSRAMRGGGGGGRIVINNNGPDNGIPVNGLSQNQGLTTTIAGGLNYNDRWKGKTDVNASYFYNYTDLETDQQSSRQNLSPVNPFTYDRQATSERRNQGHRLNAMVDHRIDTFHSIKFTPQFQYQRSQNAQASTYASFIPGGKDINEGVSNSSRDAEAYQFTGDLLFRKRFPKKGRTLSATLGLNYNDSKSRSFLYTENRFYEDNGTIGSGDTLDQRSTQNSLTRGTSLQVAYTEQFWKRSLLEFNAFANLSRGQSDKITYDLNEGSGKYEDLNELLTNRFENAYSTSGGGVSWRTQRKKWLANAGANVQYATLESTQPRLQQTVRQDFVNVLPSAMVQYNISRMKNLRIQYNTSTRQPSVYQLQPVPDISDPLNIYEGNPELEQEYTHSLQTSFFAANPGTQRNLIAFVNVNFTNAAIVNADEIMPNGVRVSRPVNVHGVYNAFANLEAGFPIKKLNLRLGIGGGYQLNRTVRFLNTQRNNILNQGFNPRFSMTYQYKEKLNLQATARLGFNQVTYSLQPELNDDYLRHQYGLEGTWTLPAKFSINSEFNYTAYSGRPEGYNTSVALWNLGLARSFLKNNRGELKFSVNDLLNQNVGINRNVDANYIEDVRFTTLQRYFLLSFTYNLNRGGPQTGGPRVRLMVN